MTYRVPAVRQTCWVPFVSERNVTSSDQTTRFQKSRPRFALSADKASLRSRCSWVRCVLAAGVRQRTSSAFNLLEKGIFSFHSLHNIGFERTGLTRLMPCAHYLSLKSRILFPKNNNRLWLWAANNKHLITWRNLNARADHHIIFYMQDCGRITTSISMIELSLQTH